MWWGKPTLVVGKIYLLVICYLNTKTNFLQAAGKVEDYNNKMIIKHKLPPQKKHRYKFGIFHLWQYILNIWKFSPA